MDKIITKKSLPSAPKSNLFRRIPLPVKMLVVVFIVGFGIWASLEYTQSRSLEIVFNKLWAGKLAERALEDRLNFDRYVKAYLHSIKIFISQKKFSDYIDRQKWFTVLKDRDQIKYYTQPPPWFPKSSVLRTFTSPPYALLLDKEGRVREVYESKPGTIPSSLIKPSQLLLLKSQGQNFMTTLEDKPYLVSSKTFTDSYGTFKGYLMFASPIDDEFLNSSLGIYHSPGHEMALLTPDKAPKILTSTNVAELPPGMPISSLKGRYLITGREFFDYGSSDLPIKLASFVSMKEVKALTKSIVSIQRQQRAIAAPIFILTFALIMFWITRRVQRMAQRVADFSEHSLGIKQEEFKRGDQLNILEERFLHLTDNILQARDALMREADRRITLEKQQLEVKQKERQLVLLHTVTEVVGVGVITITPDGLKAANQQMERFAQMCGGLSVFYIQDIESLERTIVDKKGRKRVFQISSPTIFKEEKILLVQDITEIKAHTEALEHMALHDALTGLPNRILFYDRLNQALLARQREGKSLAILMMDLDRFKEINDNFGHHAGDMVLKEVGLRLHSVLRQSDTIARFGGDEFAILLPVSDVKHAEQVSYRLQSALKQPLIVDDNTLYLGISIGIAIYPVHGEVADTLVKNADIAMYVAKEAKSGFSIYSPEHERCNVPHIELMGELNHAIEHEENLTLYYQPKVNCKTGSVSGVEALVRWLHPRHGVILPDSFIPLAEHSGLVKTLTCWALNTAMRQCADWLSSGIEVRVSVNLSARNLQEPQLAKHVSDVLGVWGIAPTCLELEITESAMMLDQASAIKTLVQLKDLGVQLSIDNFGTGYSALSYLKKLPVDGIKIFKSFVINMAEDNNDAMIVRSTIDLAHNFGLKVVAVGVESEELMETLEKLGCDELQGNYICPPLSAGELTRWLSESKWKLEKKVLKNP